MIVKRLYTPPKVEFDEIEFFSLLAGSPLPSEDKTTTDPDWEINQGGGDGGETDDDGFV